MTDADPEFDVEIRDGKTYARVEDLELWEENPREAEEGDLDRLEKMLGRLGQFKPLLALEDGTVIAGNMRLRTMREMEWDEAWVEVVRPEDEDQLIEFALADNDRVGSYDERQVGELLGRYDVDITMFKPDFYRPTDLAQNVARAMDPEAILAMTEGPDEDGEDGEDAAERGSDPKPRGSELLGQTSPTAMVQLYMTEDEKKAMMDGVAGLKEEYGLDNTSDVVQRAIDEEYNAHCVSDTSDPVPLSEKIGPDDIE